MEDELSAERVEDGVDVVHYQFLSGHRLVGTVHHNHLQEL